MVINAALRSIPTESASFDKKISEMVLNSCKEISLFLSEADNRFMIYNIYYIYNKTRQRLKLNRARQT